MKEQSCWDLGGKEFVISDVIYWLLHQKRALGAIVFCSWVFLEEIWMGKYYCDVKTPRKGLSLRSFEVAPGAHSSTADVRLQVLFCPEFLVGHHPSCGPHARCMFSLMRIVQAL